MALREGTRSARSFPVVCWCSNRATNRVHSALASVAEQRRCPLDSLLCRRTSYQSNAATRVRSTPAAGTRSPAVQERVPSGSFRDAVLRFLQKESQAEPQRARQMLGGAWF